MNIDDDDDNDDDDDKDASEENAGDTIAARPDGVVSRANGSVTAVWELILKPYHQVTSSTHTHLTLTTTTTTTTTTTMTTAMTASNDSVGGDTD